MPGIDLPLFGCLLVVTVAFAPEGILGLIRRLGRARRPAPAET